MKNILFTCLLLSGLAGYAQNPKLKCYFNKPVNTALSSGTNAVDLSTAFPDTIAAYINRAKFTLDVAVYNFSSTGADLIAKIVTAVNNAYARGVVVRWISDGSSGNSGLTLLSAGIQRIASPTTAGYGIMHNKFVVIDVNSASSTDPYIITGSYNFTLSQTTTDYNNLLIIQDKNVATAYYNEFNKMWGGTGPAPNLALSAFGTNKTTSAAHYFNVNGTAVDVHFSPKDTAGKYLTQVVNSANSDLFFGIYAFTDNSVANAILNKFNAGLVVRGVMDNFSNAYSPYTTLSTPLGSDMISYSGAGLYHNKVMLADALLPSSDPTLATGSFNWSTSAESSNDENFIVIHDATIANQYYQSLCKNITDMGGTACIVVLPLQWISVEANLENNTTAQLHWETANEYNNDHFEIERSADAIHFGRIGIVSAIQNHSSNPYQFTDAHVNEGLNYYRLKQVDLDGNATYSKTVLIYNRTAASLTFYPNPVRDLLQVSIPTACTQLLIHNEQGVVIKHINTTGRNSTTINLGNLARGVYFLKAIGASSVIEKQFIKL